MMEVVAEMHAVKRHINKHDCHMAHQCVSLHACKAGSAGIFVYEKIFYNIQISIYMKLHIHSESLLKWLPKLLT